MQTTQCISIRQLDEIAGAIFDQGDVIVKEGCSAHGCPTRRFVNVAELIDDLRHQPEQRSSFSSYAIYYPEAKGHVYEKRLTLKPESCNGHTFRFSQEGWGLIHLQCDFRNYPTIKCRIAVNSAARAGNWYDTCPEYKNPRRWDWDVINKKAGRLVRLLRKCGKHAEPDASPNGGPATPPGSSGVSEGPPSVN
jgi:hypothetical protein